MRLNIDINFYICYNVIIERKKNMKKMFDVDCLKERIEAVKMGALLADDKAYVDAMNNVLKLIDYMEKGEDE